MNIQTAKLDVMKLILETDNADIIESVRKILTREKNGDFWTSLSDDQKEDIESGINEIASGEVVDYESIIGKHRK